MTSTEIKHQGFPMSAWSLAKKYAAWQWLVLAAVMLVALLLRVYHLDRESVCNDEFYCMVHLPAESLTGFLRGISRQSPDMPPLYFTLLYGWTGIFGISPVAVRAFSIILSLLCVVLLYLIAKRLFGAAAGILAALTYAFSPYHIFYGQEIRVYALFCVLGLLSALTFLYMLHGASKWWWLLNVVANVLLIYTHLFGVLLVATQFLFLVAFRFRRFKYLFLWSLLQSAGVLPMLPWVLTLYGNNSSAMTARTPFLIPLVLFFSDLSPLFMFTIPAGWHAYDLGANCGFRCYAVSLAAVGAALLLLAGLIMVLRMVLHSTPLHSTPLRLKACRSLAVCVGADSHSTGVFFLLVWFCVPTCVLYILSQTVLGVEAYQLRYVIESQIAAYIIIGGAFLGFRQRWKQRAFAALTCIVFIYAGFCGKEFRGRGDYLGAVDFFRAELPQGRGVVLACGVSEEVFRYNMGMTDFPVLSANDSVELDEYLERELCEFGEVWFVQDVRSEPEKDDPLFAAFDLFVSKHGLRYHARATAGGPGLFVCHCWSPIQPLRPRAGCQKPFEK